MTRWTHKLLNGLADAAKAGASPAELSAVTDIPADEIRAAIDAVSVRGVRSALGWLTRSRVGPDVPPQPGPGGPDGVDDESDDETESHRPATGDEADNFYSRLEMVTLRRIRAEGGYPRVETRPNAPPIWLAMDGAPWVLGRAVGE